MATLLQRRRNIEQHSRPFNHITRAMSPPLGSSSLITSAPRKPRICVQAGPAWLCVMSMMRMPDRALSMVAFRMDGWDDRVLAIGAGYGSIIHEECHDGP